MTVAGRGREIAQHQIFFKRPRGRDHLSGAVHGEAGSIEDQLVVAAHLVHVDHGLSVAPRGGAVNTPADGALAQVVGRGVDADEHLGSGREQFLDGVALIEAVLPEAAVVPGVFTNGERHRSAAQRAQILALRRAEVARFVEHVVVGQQHFALPEQNFAALNQRRPVHRLLAGFRLRAPHVTADDAQAEIRGFARQAFQLALRAFDETGFFHQIARRVAGEGELGKHHHFGAASGGIARGADHAVDVPREVPHGGIELRQSDAHGNSIVTGACARAGRARDRDTLNTRRAWKQNLRAPRAAQFTPTARRHVF